MRIVLVGVGVVLAACFTKPNPDYCYETSDCRNGHVCSNHSCVPVADDAGPGDASSTICELDDECTSGVCAEGGQCELAENVLYVDPDGISAGSCPSEMPCEISYAFTQVNAQRAVIRLANGTYSLATDLLVDHELPRTTVVGGSAAVLSREAGGAAIEVRGLVTQAAPGLRLRGVTLHKGIDCAYGMLAIERVTFDNPSPEVRPWIEANTCMIELVDSMLRDSRADGLSLLYGEARIIGTTIESSAGNGIDGSSSSLTIERSTITRSGTIGVAATGIASTTVSVYGCVISNNLLGGVSSFGARYEVVNNFVYRNGHEGDTPANSSQFGGLKLESSVSSRAMHNTIVFNTAEIDATPIRAGGIYCTNGSADNNIIVQNFRGNAELPNAQTGGSCDFGSSLIGPEAAPVGFIDLLADDLRLGSASPARNAGAPSDIDVDFDGDARSDGLPDLGADEYVP